MPLSRYCKIYPLPDDPGQVLLFSTLTTSAAQVAQDVVRDIETGNLSEEEKETLDELGFLVENEDEERREMLAFVDALNAEDTAFRATVALNLDCNLACKYCFEGTRKGNHFMSADTADAFVEFVKKNLRGDDEEINLAFYGGEPLLSPDTIMRISEKLKSFAESRKLSYDFALITNGTLLTKAVIEKLRPYGLRSACVTLDGPREIHDAFRPFKSGKGSFDVILDNIRRASSMIDVHLGGNYTRERCREFPRLLDSLLASGLGPDKISSVKFDPVINETAEMSPDFHDGCTSITEPWLVEASIILREEILSRGFRTQEIMPTVCLMERRGLVVNYDGSLYKCPGLLGRKDFCAGTVGTGMINYSLSHNLGNWENEDCLGCVYLPLCFGGCRYMKFLRDGTLRDIDCKKAYFDRTLEALVMQDVKYACGDKA